MKYLSHSRARTGLTVGAAIAGIALAGPVAGQTRAPEAHNIPAELRIWSDPWLAEQMRPDREERGHDLREPGGSPPVSRGAAYRSRPPSEWAHELPDDSELEDPQ